MTDLITIATKRAAILHAGAAWGVDEDGFIMDCLMDRIESLQAQLAEAQQERAKIANWLRNLVREVGEINLPYTTLANWIEDGAHVLP